MSNSKTDCCVCVGVFVTPPKLYSNYWIANRLNNRARKVKLILN